MAPSYYLNQFWLIINKVQWLFFGEIFRDIPANTIKIHLKNTSLEFNSSRLGSNELMYYNITRWYILFLVNFF